MASMGRYSKAYLLGQLRQFSGWAELTENARPENEDDVPESQTKSTSPRILTDESIVYLQEDFTVTDDIYTDEYVIFDKVTSAWKDFCVNKLGYSIPDDVLEMYKQDDQETSIENPNDDAQPMA